MPDYTWTDEQFEEMSWHDCHVHGWRVVEGEHGAGELILDLDYIVEWLCGTEANQFRIVPALLTFREVTNLRFSLDYAGPGAGLCPFSIHEIARREEDRGRYTARVWEIVINWPTGNMTFEAKGFVQRGTGKPVLTGNQCLRPEERGG